MADIRISTSFNIDIVFEAAPFYRRFFAWLIDVILIFCYVYLLFRFLESLQSNTNSNEESNGFVIAIFLFLILPVLTYHLLCEIFMNGQSPGKKIVGIKVVSENGGRPSIGQYIIRWLIRTSDYMIFVFLFNAGNLMESGVEFAMGVGAAFCLLLLDLILIITNKRGQRLGDILAHTFVINTRQKTSIDDTIFMDVSQSYSPSFPQVMQLSDRDINAIKRILDVSQKNNDFTMAANASERIKSHLNIQTNLSPFEFLEILLKDYNYLSAR